MSNIVDNYKDIIEELLPESKHFNNIICDKIADTPLKDIAKKMGYGKIEKGVERIKFVMNDPQFGLLKSNYDGLYSSITFLDKLLEIIGLPKKEIEEYIKHIHFLSNDVEFGYRPHIFCDTNFVRKNEPVFILAFLSNRRFLSLSKTIKRKSKSEKIKIVKEIIYNHQIATGGKIEFWGSIARYVCHFDKNEIVEFLPDGTIICEKNEPVFHPTACLKIGNKVLVGSE